MAELQALNVATPPCDLGVAGDVGSSATKLGTAPPAQKVPPNHSSPQPENPTPRSDDETQIGTLREKATPTAPGALELPGITSVEHSKVAELSCGSAPDSRETVETTPGGNGTEGSTAAVAPSDLPRDVPCATVELRRLLGPLSKEQLIDLLSTAAIEHEEVRKRCVDCAQASPACRRLMVRNVHFKTLDADFRAFFLAFGGLDDALIVREKDGMSKGYGFVTFSTSAAAEACLASRPLLLEGRELQIKLAADPYAARQQSKLFVRNLSDSTTSEMIRDVFSQFGLLEECVVVRDLLGRSKGYGFIKFVSPADAFKAVQQSERVVDGRIVFIHFATPVTSRRQQQQQQQQQQQPHQAHPAESGLVTKAAGDDSAGTSSSGSSSGSSSNWSRVGCSSSWSRVGFSGGWNRIGNGLKNPQATEDAAPSGSSTPASCRVAASKSHGAPPSIAPNQCRGPLVHGGSGNVGSDGPGVMSPVPNRRRNDNRLDCRMLRSGGVDASGMGVGRPGYIPESLILRDCLMPDVYGFPCSPFSPPVFTGAAHGDPLGGPPTFPQLFPYAVGPYFSHSPSRHGNGGLFTNGL